MKTSKRRIRKTYAPLVACVTLYCASQDSSPLTQAYNAKAATFEPNRSLSPLLLYPEVVLKANDGSLKTPYGNESLSSMKWYIDGVDISTIPAYSGKYSIETESNSLRGQLTLLYNVPVQEQHTISFEADVADTRTGKLIHVKTDGLVMSTTDMSEDKFTLTPTQGEIQQYNPFLDRFFHYQYKVANGLMDASAAAESEAKDNNSYLRTMTFSFFQGSTEITSGYTLKLYSVASDGTLTEMAASDGNEVDSISASGIVLDLRLVEKGNYAVKAYVDEKEKAACQFSFGRVNPAYSAEIVNTTDIAPGDTSRGDRVLIDSGGKAVECPESIIRIVWHTATNALSDVSHGEGDHVAYTLASTGIGSTYNDSWMDTWVETTQKAACSVLTDGNGNEYVDGSGNQFIGN